MISPLTLTLRPRFSLLLVVACRFCKAPNTVIDELCPNNKGNRAKYNVPPGQVPMFCALGVHPTVLAPVGCTYSALFFGARVATPFNIFALCICMKYIIVNVQRNVSAGVTQEGVGTSSFFFLFLSASL